MLRHAPGHAVPNGGGDANTNDTSSECRAIGSFFHVRPKWCRRVAHLPRNKQHARCPGGATFWEAKMRNEVAYCAVDFTQNAQRQRHDGGTRAPPPLLGGAPPPACGCPLLAQGRGHHGTLCKWIRIVTTALDAELNTCSMAARHHRSIPATGRDRTPPPRH